MRANALRRLGTCVVASALMSTGVLGLAVAGASNSSADEPAPTPSATAPAPAPAPASFPLRPGDEGPLIKVLHERLAWLGYPISGSEAARDTYGPSTSRALASLQKKFWLPNDRYVTRKTWDRLRTLAGPVGELPEACTSEDSICISTQQKLVRWIVNGKVAMSADARFGLPQAATARGTFTVTRKSRDHVSSLYGTAMPFSLFFHGGQAVHYSAYFKRDGYYGASHGCVNLRDLKKAEWLFNSAKVGDRVHVY
jgi:peptidoglycan hydrolase-like protein with peptidoglycan-binding domain